MTAPADCPICCPAGWSPNIDQTPDEDCPEHGRQRPKREVFALSLELKGRLSDLADSFLDEESDELETELSSLIQHATRGQCIDCGTYEACPCNERADWIATGGY